MLVMPHCESPAPACSWILHPRRQGLGRLRVLPGAPLASRRGGLSTARAVQGPVGCCCSPWGSVQPPSPSPQTPWLQAGLGAAALPSLGRYSPGPPGNLQVFPWARELRPQTFPPCMGQHSEISTNSEKMPHARERRLMQGQTLPVKRTLTLGGCCCAAIPGRTWGHPFLPAPGACLTPLSALCQAAPAPTGALGHCQPCSPPASPAHPLPGPAGKLASPPGKRGWCPAGLAPLLSRFRCLLRAPALSHTHIPPFGGGGMLGDVRGDGAAWGRCLHCRQGVQAAGHPAAGSVKLKGRKIPGGKLCSAPASKGLSSLHKPPRSPGLLCSLRLLHPPRAWLVPKSEPANQQLPAAAALRLP